MESYGGPLATAGGLIFIAGTRDQMIRAFDKNTGKVLWQYQLPNAGFSTPITYAIDGIQYIAIAAGGGRGLATGGNYLAFRLPEKDLGGLVPPAAATDAGHRATSVAPGSASAVPNTRPAGPGGWILFAFFTTLALLFRRYPLLKGFSFTVMIFAAVSLAMYYPSHFTHIGDFKLSRLILPLLQLIMFGMGTELSIKEFKTVISMPCGILVGVICHYTLMPLISFTLAAIAMVWDITRIVILPIPAGLLFHYIVRGRMPWLDRAMPLVSMIGIALIIVVITAAGRDSLLKVGLLLIAATFLQNFAGYVLGYWSARLLGLAEKDRRTIALEVGMQNAGLASGLALAMGKLATVGLAPAVFGPMMNISGSALATWWHRKVPE